jgi:hypothetical protein
MNIDVSKCTPNGGFLMRQLPKEADPKDPLVEFDARGFKERTGAEVFVFLSAAAINGANAKCGFQALKGFRKTIKDLSNAVAKGEWIANKTDIDVIKHSINGNQNWPNADEIFDVLEAIMDRLEKAAVIEG